MSTKHHLKHKKPVKATSAPVKPQKIPTIEWQAEESLPKNLPWLVITFLIFAGLITLTIYLKLYLTAVLIFVATIVIYRFAYLEPEKVKITLSDKEIKVNQHSYPIVQVRSFWIAERKKHPTLNLSVVNPLFSRLSLPLGKTDPQKIRRTLRRALIPEYASWQDLIVTEIGKIIRL